MNINEHKLVSVLNLSYGLYFHGWSGHEVNLTGWRCTCFFLSVSEHPICGNRIVEEGEECDVGHDESDPCCYSSKEPAGIECRLKPDKQCRFASIRFVSEWPVEFLDKWNFFTVRCQIAPLTLVVLESMPLWCNVKLTWIVDCWIIKSATVRTFQKDAL